MPRTNDARFDALADVYGRVSESLADLLATMLVTTSASARQKMHTEVLRRLRELESQTQAWVRAYAAAMLEEERDQLGILLLLGLSVAQRDKLVADAANQAQAAILARLTTAIGSVRALAASANSGISPIAMQAAVDAARASSSAALGLRGDLRQKLVSVLTTNGKLVRFEPSYYAALTAFMEIGFAAQEVTKAAMEEAGRDLVRISPNPSTIGDYCDMYRGKVFSLSGNHPDVPPLSLVPSGNVPMHPWCHHRLLPYDEVGKTSSQLQHASRLPQEFIDAAMRGEASHVFEKLWRSKAWNI